MMRDLNLFAVRVLRAFREAFFPGKCLVCGVFLGNSGDIGTGHSGRIRIGALLEDCVEVAFQRVMAPNLCGKCRSGFVPVRSPLCPECGIMFKARDQEDHLCGECITSPGGVRRARALCVYNSPMAGIIHAFKYRGKTRLAGPLGQLLFLEYLKCYGEDAGAGPSGGRILIPVPLHGKRFRKRTFNQAFLLIRTWEKYAAEFGDPILDIKIDTRSLVRKRWTDPQTGLGRKARKKNLRNAFSLTPVARIHGKKIVLIDDVYTTGTTVRECARVLLKGGAASVDVMTLARTMVGWGDIMKCPPYMIKVE